MSTLLIESITAAPVKRGSKWRVVVATPGKGSSGNYSEAVLKEFGPKAIPAGTKSWWSHEKRSDGRDMVGIFEDGAFWDDENGNLAADLTVFPHWADVVDAIGPHAESSIRVKGRKDASGNVVELYADRANSVDLVGYAGLEGSGLKFQLEELEQMIESARANDPAPGASGQFTEGDTRMEKMLEELAAAVEKLNKDFEAFVTESRQDAQGQADAEAVEAAASAKLAEYTEKFLAVKEEIATAGLLPSQVKNLEARALKGEDITEALTEAKTLVEEAKGIAQGDGTFVVLGEQLAGAANDKFTINAWGN